MGDSMKVKVKSLPVFYKGDRYEKNEEVTIEKDDFNEQLFVEVKGKKSNKSKEE